MTHFAPPPSFCFAFASAFCSVRFQPYSHCLLRASLPRLHRWTLVWWYSDDHHGQEEGEHEERRSSSHQNERRRDEGGGGRSPL